MCITSISDLTLQCTGLQQEQASPTVCLSPELEAHPLSLERSFTLFVSSVLGPFNIANKGVNFACGDMDVCPLGNGLRAPINFAWATSQTQLT